jgi:hypothetical protein
MVDFLSDIWTFNVCIIILHLNQYYVSVFAAAASNDVQPQRSQSYVDIEKLENEFVLTSAEYLLSLASVKWTYTGKSLWFFVKWTICW